MIERLLRSFEALGCSPSAAEIADALWLNSFMDDESPSASAPEMASPSQRSTTTPPRTLNDHNSPERDAPSPWPEQKRTESTIPSPSVLQAGDVVTDSVEQPFPAHGLRATPFYSAGATALPGALDLARALRPLLRHIPSSFDLILDETATVEQIVSNMNLIARHTWTPVMAPASERWLDLALVVDQWGSMAIWQSTIEELYLLFTQLGAFRNIYTYQLGVENSAPKDAASAKPTLRAATGSQRICQPKELVDTANRRLILVLSDCISPIWRNGSVNKMLAVWASQGMVTLLQMLPAHMWAGTALANSIQVDLYSSAPGLPNDWLKRELPLYWAEEETPEAVVMPIVTLEPRSLKLWARMLTGMGKDAVPGIMITNENALVSEDTEISAQERLERFQRTASPLARELAGYLAAAPLTLPVMRLVQRTMLPQSRQTHLAEFFLSGLIKRVTPLQSAVYPDAVYYDFVERELRNKLLATVGRSSSKRVLDEVSAYIGKQSNQIRKFQALIVHPDADAKIQIDKDSLPFAQVAAHVLKRLGTQYSKLVTILENQLTDFERNSRLDPSRSASSKRAVKIFPTEYQYDRAIQHPDMCFRNSQLKSSIVATSSLGLPLVWHGHFTCTFKLIDSSQNELSVRCFYKSVPDLHIRYREISRYLDKNILSCLSTFEYLEDEILVEGKRYPIIKMPWLTGEMLGRYIDRNYKNPTLLKQLAEAFYSVINDLTRLNIAHGDLTHETILVQDNMKLVLGSYENMWVPSFENTVNMGLGHPNFQHPRRTITDYGPNLDRFSSIVIYLALQVLIEKSDLWEKYNLTPKGDSSINSLLFQWRDFQDPKESLLFAELELIDPLRDYIRIFKNICLNRADNVPELRAFINLVLSVKSTKQNTSRKYPDLAQYVQAIQNPHSLFLDPKLKSSVVEEYRMGLPAVWSGNFASTFKLTDTSKNEWAIRCFHAFVPERQVRYKAISRHLNNHPSRFWWSIDYLEDEILVDGQRYPITKMPWVTGETLGMFLERNYHSRSTMINITNDFLALIDELARYEIAHGDLTHDNLIVNKGKLVLVDYDAVWVPELSGLTSSELGHSNFQHPERTASDFGPDLDRFSAIVIYIALHALIERPELWERYGPEANSNHSVDGLLFQRKDFQRPEQSALFAELESLPRLRMLINSFRKICQNPLSDVPQLSDFIRYGQEQSRQAEPVTREQLVDYGNELEVLLRNLGSGAVRKVDWFSFGIRGNVQGEGVYIEDVRDIEQIQFDWDSVEEDEPGSLSLPFSFECTVEVEALIYWTESTYTGPDGRRLYNYDGGDPLLYSVTGTPKVKVYGTLLLESPVQFTLDESTTESPTPEIYDMNIIERHLHYERQ